MKEINIAIVNLMPNKQETEQQFKSVLQSSGTNIKLTYVYFKSHNYKGTSLDYLQQNYKTLEEIKKEKIDGMIITGAPLELIEFQQVDYWDELKDLMDYSKCLKSTMFICWGAIAGLYHYYGIPRKIVDDKVFGVFEHEKTSDSLFNRMTSGFSIPHSRFFVFDEKEVEKIPKLEVLAKSQGSGTCIIATKDRKQIFMSGHLEYDRENLQREYFRDIDKGLDTAVPENYFKNNDPKQGIKANWEEDAKQFFRNWVDNYLFDINIPVSRCPISKIIS